MLDDTRSLQHTSTGTTLNVASSRDRGDEVDFNTIPIRLQIMPPIAQGRSDHSGGTSFEGEEEECVSDPDSAPSQKGDRPGRSSSVFSTKAWQGSVSPPDWANGSEAQSGNDTGKSQRDLDREKEINLKERKLAKFMSQKPVDAADLEAKAAKSLDKNMKQSASTLTSARDYEPVTYQPPSGWL